MTIYPSTSTTVQTAQLLDKEEFCKANEREYREPNIPIINFNVPILCLPNDVVPTHQLDHKQEHPIQTSRLCSSEQAVFGHVSLPLHRYISLTSLTITARVSRTYWSCCLWPRTWTPPLRDWTSMKKCWQILWTWVIFPALRRVMRATSMGHKSFSRPSRSRPRLPPLCSVYNHSCNAMVCVVSELISWTSLDLSSIRGIGWHQAEVEQSFAESKERF